MSTMKNQGMATTLKHYLTSAVSVFLVVMVSGCATFKLPANLSTAILDNEDIETVRVGLPSYLLMVDALVLTYPKNDDLFLTAAKLNSAYAGVFLGEQEKIRGKLMSEKALKYAVQAFCLYDKNACDIQTWDMDTLKDNLAQWDDLKSLPYLYTLGSAWASYIQLNSEDWLAVAQLGKVEQILKQVVAVDDAYELGMAQLYLGVMNSILPPSLGGKPDIAQAYFEGALVAGQDQNIMIYVYYASQYARLIFDQELHDELLEKALSLNPEVPGYTLQNIYAQRLAEELLASSTYYF